MSCKSACIRPTPVQAHCLRCHHTFGGIYGFDRHRRAGNCTEPTALGMVADRRGIWGNPPTANAQRSFRACQIG